MKKWIKENIFDNKLLKCVLLIGIILLQYELIMNSYDPNLTFSYKPEILFSNILVIIALDLIFSFLFVKIKYGVAFTSVLIVIWSIINYYVLDYHGSPAFPSEIRNIQSAIAVAKGYHIAINDDIRQLLLMGAALLVLAAFFLFMKEKITIRKYIIRLIPALACGAGIFILLFSVFSFKVRYAVTWSYEDAISKYGFLVCCVEDIDKSLHPLNIPEGYSTSKIEQVKVENDTATNSYPDVIVILNETFCDISYALDVQPDNDPLQNFYDIDGAIYGKASTPGVAGGTNNSEYELLTTNSMQIPLTSAPFNYIHINNSAIEYFNNLGYHTTAMHCISNTYNRATVYPQLGFDDIYLGGEAFTYYHKYGHRRWLDSDNYLDLLSHYDQDSDVPQMFYLLTYQNHGSYEQNVSSDDTVHTTLEFGEYTDDINEYLTSLSMSGNAFVDFIDQLRKIDRNIVVVMVGDHAPFFLGQMEGTNDELQINPKVPFVIWSNFDLDIDFNTDYANIYSLIPMVLKACNMPLTSYYELNLKVHDQFPIITRNQLCMDSDGNLTEYTAADDKYELVSQYYYYEYNDIEDGKDYQNDLFTINMRE